MNKYQPKKKQGKLLERKVQVDKVDIHLLAFQKISNKIIQEDSYCCYTKNAVQQEQVIHMEDL